MSRCILCLGRGYTTFRLGGGALAFKACGHCNGSREEPTITLRQLRVENQDRLRREAERREL